MSTLRMEWRSNFRVVSAIAGKDISDALKNKTTLMTLGTILFLLILYHYLPAIESATMPPRLAIFDPGDSGLAAVLDREESFDLRQIPSQDDLEAYLADRDFEVLGLALPADIPADGPLELDGYMANWYSRDQILETQRYFERELSDLLDRPVTVNLEGHTVSSRPDSRGRAFLVSVSLVLVVTMTGIIMTIQLIVEEKRAKTLDALLVSPATAGQVIMGKALTGLFYCLVICGVLLVLNGRVIGQWWLAILTVILGSLFSIGLGLLLGSALETMAQQRLWTFILFQPLLIPVFLSIMDDLLPATLIQIFKWLPTVALSTLFRAALAPSAPFGAYGPQLALVVGWATATLAASAWFVSRSDRR